MESSALPREAFLLRWSPAGTGARYRVLVTLADLTVLDTASGLVDAEYRIPVSALAKVPSGAAVLWRMEARLADGSTLGSDPVRTELR
jgi:hypothetical protein